MTDYQQIKQNANTIIKSIAEIFIMLNTLVEYIFYTTPPYVRWFVRMGYKTDKIPKIFGHNFSSLMCQI